jgi:hypothetical protein
LQLTVFLVMLKSDKWGITSLSSFF